MSPTISACMIVRDERAWIVGAIESIAPAVDELVILDTGSTDDTIGCAFDALVACGRRFLLRRRAWTHNFSEARNASIDCAHGDWIFVVDADHRLGPGAAAVIQAAAQAGRHSAYRLPTHEASATGVDPADVVSGKLRRGRPWHPVALMRRTVAGELVRYTNPVHEDPLPWLLARGIEPPALAGADIVHYGGCKTVRDARGSNERNRAMLERWRASEPTNLSPYHYLANDAYQAGDVDAAIAIVETGLRQPMKASEAPKVFSLLVTGAMCALERQRFDAAARFLAAANRHAKAAHPDVVFLSGTLLEAIGQPERALERYLAAIRMHGETWSSTAIAGATSWAARHRAAICLLAMGEHDDALEAIDSALACEGDGYDSVLRPQSVELRTAILKAKAA